MTTHSREVLLKGFGSPPAQATVVVETLAVRDRLRRAAIAFTIGVAAAVIALPIPLVHLVLVPTALLLGIVIAALRLGQREVIRSAEGACPYCGTQQRLGLAGRVFKLPRRVHCQQCQRALDLGRD